MSTTYTINVTNNSGSNQDFFIFQEPAQYSGGATPYTNALYQEQVAPASGGGGVMTFEMTQQFYAGAQEQFMTPAIGAVSGGTTTCQPVNITPATGTITNNAVNFSIDPIALPAATSLDTVQKGAFRIVAPVFVPGVQGNYNVGLASLPKIPGAPAIMSSFIVAQPNQYVDCQPIMKFYVATGSYTPGTVVNFTSASNVSVVCDATDGSTTFQVSYNRDGTWSITSQQ
ncbi:hypothetical protein [Duganella sp. LjRoot269]|jgi:hypothetical protein|uniref:hypothetical protein n=1 Tax=Duganella sp. LjRoot269 TaxID=3342305 RepID=UPI003ECCD39A